MKALTILTVLLGISLQTLAMGPIEVARKKALDYAYDNVFMDLIDGDSSMRVEWEFTGPEGYEFMISLNGDCKVKVQVDGTTGSASNKDPMKCTLLNGAATYKDHKVSIRQIQVQSVGDSLSLGALPGSKTFYVELSYCSLTNETHARTENLKLLMGEVIPVNGIDGQITKNDVKIYNLDFVQAVRETNSSAGKTDECTIRTFRQPLNCTTQPNFTNRTCVYHFNEGPSVELRVFSNGKNDSKVSL